VVAVNRFVGDPDADLEAVLRHCRSSGVESAVAEAYWKGGDGMTALADHVVDAAAASDPAGVRPIYAADLPLEAKIRTVATQVYGAADVTFQPSTRARLERLAGMGYDRLPVCIAKTPYSVTDDPKIMGAPTGWTLTISDVTLSAGAGFVVAIAGSTMLMPGFGTTPQAHQLDVDDAGRVIGMDC